MIASEAQTRFLGTLMAERVHNYQDVNVAGLTKQEASSLISILLGNPKVAQSVTVTATEGFYEHGGSVYRVQKSKNTGNLYAKILVTEEFGRAHWDYAPGVVRKLADADRLTLETARKMGHAYGVCMVCGRTLTDPSSVDAGIGPICSGKL